MLPLVTSNVARGKEGRIMRRRKSRQRFGSTDSTILTDGALRCLQAACTFIIQYTYMHARAHTHTHTHTHIHTHAFYCEW